MIITRHCQNPSSDDAQKKTRCFAKMSKCTYNNHKWNKSRVRLSDLCCGSPPRLPPLSSLADSAEQLTWSTPGERTFRAPAVPHPQCRSCSRHKWDPVRPPAVPSVPAAPSAAARSRSRSRSRRRRPPRHRHPYQSTASRLAGGGGGGCCCHTQTYRHEYRCEPTLTNTNTHAHIRVTHSLA